MCPWSASSAPGSWARGSLGSGVGGGAAALLFERLLRSPLEQRRRMLAASLERAVGRERITGEDADAKVARVAYTTRFEDLAEAEAVIEAITEDARAKGELFKRLDAELPDARFLASKRRRSRSPSSQPRTEHPERVLGMHFFNPVPLMKLVESRSGR